MIIREGHLTRYIQASLLSSSRITALNSTGISMLGLGSTRELLTLTLWDLLGLLLAVDTVRALQGLVRETKYRHKVVKSSISKELFDLNVCRRPCDC